MNGADWAIVIVLTLSSVISLVRGFIKEALSLVIWVVALVCANVFSHRLEEFLVNTISTPSLRAMTAFLLVFVGVLFLGALINFLIGLIVKATGLSGTDRLIGMVFGFARGVLLVMMFLIYVPNYVPVTKDSWFQQSQLIPYFSPYQAAVQNGINGITSWVVSLLRKPEATSV
ncbi:CvpA family protein [Cellvibrio sp.]|uniref:CvpA family protein n=1 Tax=Cellvibrio sp. TaxID=1965322 RepID=UPI00396484AA